ncbi:aldo/keto reductase [Frigidibacter oleivorans]|uniref:aldo/keto reductase n=1 Tax=Frigidibacter oleivorans TaxID=2487129 RepID=UPI00197AF24B|nr:aldo/keto reductase [Frigidibacter oleivorans]
MTYTSSPRSTSRRAFIAGASAMALTAYARPRAALAQENGPRPILRAIPATGEQVPVIGLGTFETFDITPGEPRDHVRDVLRRFHEAGGRVIDTSPLYGMSEVVTGDYLTELGLTNEMFITNKTWTTGDYLSDNSHSERQLRQSQERLWRNQIDVLQVHSLENHDQVRHWLAQKKEEGVVRYIGATQWSPEYWDTMERLVNTGTLDFVQIAYTILSRTPEQRLLDACADNGVAVQINIPFEKARLFTPVADQPLPDFAAELGIESWAQYFLKWIVSHPAVTNVVPATSNPEHVADNMGALYGDLPDVEMRERMASYYAELPGVSEALRQPPYPGKTYGGVVTWPFPQRG